MNFLVEECPLLSKMDSLPVAGTGAPYDLSFQESLACDPIIDFLLDKRTSRGILVNYRRNVNSIDGCEPDCAVTESKVIRSLARRWCV